MFSLYVRFGRDGHPMGGGGNIFRFSLIHCFPLSMDIIFDGFGLLCELTIGLLDLEIMGLKVVCTGHMDYTTCAIKFSVMLNNVIWIRKRQNERYQEINEKILLL